MMRWLTALFFLLLTSSGLLGPGKVSLSQPAISPPPPTVEPENGLALPPQGLYDSCLIQQQECVNHLDKLAERGFELILNYGQLYGNSAAQIAYADRAQSLGMKIIWSINYRPDWTVDNLLTKYADLAAECECSDNLGLIAYFVNLVKDHPATWGYYLADEVSPEEHDRLLVYSDLIKQLDPDHPRLYIVAGSNDPMELYFNFPSFMQDTADVVGPCYYPYGYIDEGTSLTRYTGDAARLAQEWADSLGLQPAIVLQAFSQTRYARVPLCLPWPSCAPFPSYAQMKAQRDQVLLNSRPAIILWWTYQDILQTEDPDQHLDELAAAAFAPVDTPALPRESHPAACPAGWNCADIGSPALAGTQTLVDGTWTIASAGWDIWTRMWEKADQFRYIWKPATGGLELVARLVSQEETHPSAKAGLMVRKTFDPLSPFYAVYATPERGVRVQYRAGFLEKTHDLAAVSGSAPVFLRIEQSGSTFRAFHSADGEHWRLVSKSTVDLPALEGDLMAGMAVSSHAETALSTVEFDQVFVQAFLGEPQGAAAGTLQPGGPSLVIVLTLVMMLMGVILLVIHQQAQTSHPRPQDRSPS